MMKGVAHFATLDSRAPLSHSHHPPSTLSQSHLLLPSLLLLSLSTSLHALQPPISTFRVRVIVATRLTTTGRAWHEIFYRYNSGTYNNAWMTVDYKLFTPGQPLPQGIFWVSEQVCYRHRSAERIVVGGNGGGGVLQLEAEGKRRKSAFSWLQRAALVPAAETRGKLRSCCLYSPYSASPLIPSSPSPLVSVLC